MKNHNLLIFLVTALLTACGGGGGGGAPPINAMPGGIFQGTLNNQFANSIDGVIGIVDESGEAAFLDSTNSAVYVFTVTPSGDNFASTFTAYAGQGQVFPNGSATTSGTITGTVASRTGITGSGTAAGGPANAYSVAYQAAVYESPPSFPAIAGEYQWAAPGPNSNNSVTTRVTISNTGTFTGSTSDACMVSGTFSIPHASYNAYRLQGSRNCSGGPTAFSGLAAYLPGLGQDAGSLLIEYHDAAIGAFVTPQKNVMLPTFAGPQNFATTANGFPIFVTTADINSDGKPDLIVANYYSNVSILLNTTTLGSSTPTFAAQQSFGAGSGPTSIVTPDVNADGKPDLVVVNYLNHTVSVLLNTTTPGATGPSFATQQAFATGGYPISVATADFDGDGKPDLVTANNSSQAISVLLNTTPAGASSPSFATQQMFGVARQPRSVTTLDVNSDGRPDVAVATDNNIQVLLNTTSIGSTFPNFSIQRPIGIGGGPLSIGTADIDADARPDLLVADEGTGMGSLLLNKTIAGASSPIFASPQTFATGRAFSLTVTDVNRDSKFDLVVTNADSNTVSLLIHTADSPIRTPVFALRQTFAAGSSPWGLAAADINGDGRTDLIVTNSSSSSASVLINSSQ